MRTIKYLAIHCSATKASSDVGAKDIRKWHVEGNGWSDIGYHYVIRRNGVIEKGRPVEIAGAHVSGYNSNSIGICLVGGIDSKGKAEENYTPEQWSTLETFIKDFRKQYPKAEILGHRDFPNVKKDCPCFDVRAKLKAKGW